MLDIDKKPEQQMYAALAISAAVEDRYDFQLWLLQSDSAHPSELILKANNKKDKNYNDNDKSNSNNDDDINNNNNKNENIQKSMTGIEKLVSLLYHSTNNVSYIMQNRPNLDELQVNVLHAISVAIGLNPDVQGALLKIVKSDVRVNKNGDINKSESSSVGGKVNIDQSVFMNYLIKIAEQSNNNNSNNNNNDINNENKNRDNDNNNDYNVSYELTNKIWSFIADLLEDRALINYQHSTLTEKVREEISKLVDMGEFFLTEFWFFLAARTYDIILNLYNDDIEKRPNLKFELNVNGETIDENNKSQKTKNTVSTDLNHGTWLSILKNNLVVGNEIISQNETMKLKVKDELKNNSTGFLRILNEVFKVEDS